ncbi:RNA polymerase sigma factor [Haloferula chungangensis]|uniref:RNA polymerase sigma factor n=1 Tax=Haloferula chungangensis TaxID=1048331 RepID=A0ABW2L4L6_9BACT
MSKKGGKAQEKGRRDVEEETVTSESAAANPEGMPETREQFIEQAMADFESPLVGYAMGFVHDLDRARDVVQDTFIRLCRQDIEKVRGGLKSWLFTVCRNRALDILRKESRMTALEEESHERTLSSLAAPDSEVDFNERIEQVLSYMERLPENQRDVILMKFRDGMSYKEISKATGLSGGNVGFLIHKGVKRLRQLLPEDLMEGQ